MKNDRTASDLAADGAGLYPHIKITNEVFPRLLATRRIEDDAGEYFGAFLTKTAVRILIDFLNRTFRLRSCDIDIDGTFPVPCTQFYHKRCLAPCVASLCDPAEYQEMVDLVRLFLANRRAELGRSLRQKIAASSDELDFEKAVFWRDILIAAEEFWQNPRLDIWLDDTVDTYDADETVAGSFIYLVTQRAKNVLGRKAFPLPRGGGLPPHEALEEIIASFYRFHLPREIRVSMDFERRDALIRELSARFGRPAKIVLTRPDKQRITAIRALQSAWFENELEFLKDKATPRQISGELRRLFGLEQLPTRVEAFDVAHISGTSFVAASSVWENGRFAGEEYRIHVSDQKSELGALSNAVMSRLSYPGLTTPGLILIDGGRPQLNAVRSLWEKTDSVNATFAGAVKPSGKHTEVSYFLTDGGQKIEFDRYNPAHTMLQLLRDAAHDLANRAHRDLRDMVHHYELAALLPSLNEIERRELVAAVGSLRKIRELDTSVFSRLLAPELAARIGADIEKDRSESPEAVIPLIVPIRFVAESGDADDLIPISFS